MIMGCSQVRKYNLQISVGYSQFQFISCIFSFFVGWLRFVLHLVSQLMISTNTRVNQQTRRSVPYLFPYQTSMDSVLIMPHLYKLVSTRYQSIFSSFQSLSSSPIWFYGHIDNEQYFLRIGVSLSNLQNSIFLLTNHYDGFHVQDVTSNTTLLELLQSHVNNGIPNALPSPPDAAFITTLINGRESISNNYVRDRRLLN